MVYSACVSVCDWHIMDKHVLDEGWNGCNLTVMNLDLMTIVFISSAKVEWPNHYLGLTLFHSRKWWGIICRWNFCCRRASSGSTRVKSQGKCTLAGMMLMWRCYLAQRRSFKSNVINFRFFFSLTCLLSSYYSFLVLLIGFIILCFSSK